MVFMIAFSIFLLQWIMLTKLLIGRWIYAAGSNPSAALLSGIPVPKILVSVYAISGTLTAIGACLLSSRINTGHPTVGADTALEAVAAVVIGGVSLLGGRGNVWGVLLGALFLGVLANALNLLNISSYVQTVIVGCTIIIAVALDRMRISTNNS